MKNLSVKQKLWSLIVLFITLFIIYGVLNSRALHLIERDANFMDKESLPELIHFTGIEKLVLEVQNMLSEAMLENESHKLEEAKHEAEKIGEEVAILRELNKNNPAKLKQIDSIHKEIKEFYNHGVEIALSHINAKNKDANLIHQMEEFAKNVKKIEDELEHEVSIIEKNVDGNATEIVEQAEMAFMEGIIAIIVAVIVGLIGGFWLANNITSSLTQIQSGLTSFFSFLNRETDKAELINLNSKDEFGQMATAINNNISAIEKGLISDANAVANSVEVANKIKAGYLNEQITANPNNPQLIELRNVLNEMLQTLSSKVSHDLNELDHVFKAFIASDFTARVKNPKGQVDIITNNLGDEISNMLSSSLQNGIDLQTDAGSLKQAVESLSTASNQQAASLEETAAAMEEMTSNVQNNVSKSNEMAAMATQTDSAAREGAVLAQRTATAMTEIQGATNSINDAVAIIENIAFQTNILSLNAAVEAATAGDAGKGFAVVAQEVRNLANRSADAAKEIKAMAAQAAGKSNEGMNIATELTRGFEVIADKIAQTASMVQDVSNANREQMQGIGQINTAVTQLDQMTQENAKVAAQADSIANATIEKAEAMVQDAQSKEFVGKNNIRATQSTQRTNKPAQAAKPVVVSKNTHTSKALPKKGSAHDGDVWENF